MNSPYSSRASRSCRSFLIVLAFALAIALVISAAENVNVAGHWVGEMTTESGDSVAIHLRLTQNENAIKGTGGPQGADEPVSDAKLEGNHLTLTIGSAPEPVWKFDLTVAGKSISGKAEGSKDTRSIGTTRVTLQLQ